MFGRKNKGLQAAQKRPTDVEDIEDETLDTDAEPEESDVEDEELVDAVDSADAGDDEAEDNADDLEDEDSDDADVEEDEDEEDEDEEDEWEALDRSRDWREDGPFDLDEVDLEGDDVPRMDFGSIIMTPTENSQLQLQVEQDSGAVQAALIMMGNSGLELALFAAPRSGGLAKQVRDEMMASVETTGGSCEFAEGPFGVEVRRIVPVKAPDGQDALHVSRTWMAEGPRWLLRGVLMGQACVSQDPQDQEEFVDFFKNIVVRRGNDPMPPGDLIPMSLPDELRPPQQ